MTYPRTSRLTALLGSASLLTLANAGHAYSAEVVAQAEEIPETVLITGSLIRGTAAVGVPVVNLSPQDFAMTGTLTASDLFRTIPQFNVNPGPVATGAANNERGTRVNLRQLDTGSAPRSLLMIDGMRYPQQGNGLWGRGPFQLSLRRFNRGKTIFMRNRLYTDETPRQAEDEAVNRIGVGRGGVRRGGVGRVELVEARFVSSGQEVIWTAPGETLSATTPRPIVVLHNLYDAHNRYV